MRLVIFSEEKLTNGLPWEEGDIVGVFADGVGVGIEVSIDEWVAAGNVALDFPNPFYTVIDIPGEPGDLALQSIPYEAAPLTGDPGNRNPTAKRAWKISKDELTAGEWTTIQAPGAVVIVDRGACRRKKDDATMGSRVGLGTDEPKIFADTKPTRIG